MGIMQEIIVVIKDGHHPVAKERERPFKYEIQFTPNMWTKARDHTLELLKSCEAAFTQKIGEIHEQVGSKMLHKFRLLHKRRFFQKSIH